MKIKQLAELLNAEICTADASALDTTVTAAFASDMMSDVLAFAKDQNVLISGLCNPQTIRTAVMLDMKAVVLVRGKQPSPEMITLADTNGIVLLASKMKMYPACGVMYANGVSAGEYSL